MTNDQKHPPPPESKSISISGDVRDSNVIIGDNNTINQTFFQKIINIFKSDSETLEQRNRRILFNHVENAWIKGVLDASLHGAALLDLGIKQDPEAVNKYPWALKKESTNEPLPTGASMLEIFDSIGMGRSLLILGAPGSGKTTMLLELARGLIARAREDITQPIPMVFNLASWTEKLTLADWLAQELNNLYSVPRKTAPDWIKGDKLLLLLDGLDEVRQESRAKCVEAINAFRKEHGLTSLAVCSRSQDYADLNTKLSFEGVIEVQPLTQEQITEFFNRFGEEMAGIKQVLEKDNALREMAETPLFLSIMILAYRDKRDVEILISGDEKVRRKHLFDTYIERMIERRSSNEAFNNKDVLNWLSWLSNKMQFNNITVLYHAELSTHMLSDREYERYELIYKIIIGSIYLLAGLLIGDWLLGITIAILLMVFTSGKTIAQYVYYETEKIEEVDKVLMPFIWRFFSLIFWAVTLTGAISYHFFGLNNDETSWVITRVAIYFINSLFIGTLIVRKLKLQEGNWLGCCALLLTMPLALVIGTLVFGFLFGISLSSLDSEMLRKSCFVAFIGLNFIFLSRANILYWLENLLKFPLIYSLITGLFGYVILGWLGLLVGALMGWSMDTDKNLFHAMLSRMILYKKRGIPLRLVPFLDHCVDLIFLRRVGGGYIFVHRLLMEHFAEMYVETPTSKGNKK